MSPLPHPAPRCSIGIVAASAMGTESPSLRPKSFVSTYHFCLEFQKPILSLRVEKDGFLFALPRQWRRETWVAWPGVGLRDTMYNVRNCMEYTEMRWGLG